MQSGLTEELGKQLYRLSEEYIDTYQRLQKAIARDKRNAEREDAAQELCECGFETAKFPT